MLSYYVESWGMENTGLDRDVRFSTRMEAERALRTLGACVDRNGRPPTIEESSEPPTVTFQEWNENVP